MYYLIISSTFLICIIISFFIGKRITKKSFNKVLSRGTGKMGIIRFEVFPGIKGYIEIEELDSVNNSLTKIIIHDVLLDRDSKETSKKDALKKWGGNDWVRTSEIKWYDNNSQKIRDNKINELLK